MQGTKDGTGVKAQITRLTTFYSTVVLVIHTFKSTESTFKLKQRWVFFTVYVRGGTSGQQEGGGLET